MDDFKKILSRMIELLRDGEFPMFNILEIIISENNNSSYRSIFLAIKDDVFNDGKSMTEQMKRHPELFPEKIIELISIGEQTGELEEALRKSVELLSTSNSL
ncbi:MAG: type II secretion system F family protein [Halobacteriovoraceae bacterium]|nr:type II secretion system F family protein [Halobacteriovoraceae bacterium]